MRSGPGRRTSRFRSYSSGRAVQRRSIGRPSRPLGQVLEEGEERLVRPVQVLEDEHRLPPFGPRLEHTAPRAERLLLRGGLATRADERQQARFQPGDVGALRRERPVELRGSLLGRVRLENPALCLDDLPERPEGDAVSVGKTAALAPANEPGAALDLGEQLRAEAALADPRFAHDRHELAGALAGRRARTCRRGVPSRAPGRRAASRAC